VTMDFTRFDERFRLVQKEIDDTLSGDPKRLYDACKHITNAGGKRVRPLICLLSCEAVGGKTADAVKTAAALELVHTFTLIHDDIMDDDDLRRGRPSVHKMYGESTAILAGDLLFSKAFELCNEPAVRVLARAASEICEGQEMDMSFERTKNVSEKEYLEMIRRKTAVLLEAAAESGAILGKASKGQVKALADYGRDLGLAFQIHDDVLDLTADEKKLGKPVGSDIVEGKRSLIVIRALVSLQGEDRKKLLKILDKDGNSDAEVNAAVELLKDCGAIDYCTKKAKDASELAKESLRTLPESSAKTALLELADFVVARQT
jgi:geranylgeranyl diphosphate synthase type I